jgi:hypothetical protein
MASQLIRIIGAQYEQIVDGLSDEVGSTSSEDDQEGLIKGRTDIGLTEKEQLVKARRGQGIFSGECTA